AEGWRELLAYGQHDDLCRNQGAGISFWLSDQSVRSSSVHLRRSRRQKIHQRDARASPWSCARSWRLRALAHEADARLVRRVRAAEWSARTQGKSTWSR